MDPFKIEYPIIIESNKPFVDLHQNILKNDKFLIRCLEDIENGLVIIVYLDDLYYLFEDFKRYFIDINDNKFNTEEKKIKEFSKYYYGYEIKYEKYERISIEFGIYNINTKNMILLLHTFPYKYKGKNLVRDFNLDFTLDY